MNTLFEDCPKCDTADEKVNYLERFIVNRILGTQPPKDWFYFRPHYNSAEACKYLCGISKKTLDNICKDKEITFSTPRGRRLFKRKDLEAYIRRNKHRSKYKDILDQYDLQQ